MSVPRIDSLLVPYSTNVDALITASPQTYQVSPETVAEYSDLHAAYVQSVTTLNVAREGGVRSESQTAARNTARANLLKLLRQLYTNVQSGSAISDADKIALGVRAKAKHYTRSTPPTHRPAVRVMGVVGSRVSINIADPASRSGRRKAPGTYGAHVWSFVGKEYPSDPTAWQFQGGASGRSYTIDFGTTGWPGARVWVCAQWVNRRQQPGPRSFPVSTNIQFGSLQSAA